MPKEKYDLTFEDAKPNDEIYKDKGITATTIMNPNPPRKTVIESDEDVMDEAEIELELRKEALRLQPKKPTKKAD